MVYHIDNYYIKKDVCEDIVWHADNALQCNKLIDVEITLIKEWFKDFGNDCEVEEVIDMVKSRLDKISDANDKSMFYTKQIPVDLKKLDDISS